MMVWLCRSCVRGDRGSRDLTPKQQWLSNRASTNMSFSPVQRVLNAESNVQSQSYLKSQGEFKSASQISQSAQMCEQYFV